MEYRNSPNPTPFPTLKIRAMKPEEIIEGNISIVLFMGREMELPSGCKLRRFALNGLSVLETQLAYNSSWDWLIPVCKKCRDISLSQDRPSQNHCSKLDWLETEISIALRDYEIDKVWTAVIAFVKLYFTQLTR